LRRDARELALAAADVDDRQQLLGEQPPRDRGVHVAAQAVVAENFARQAHPLGPCVVVARNRATLRVAWHANIVRGA
jgi:hypothetical protein